MDDARLPPPDDEPKIADAEALFRETPKPTHGPRLPHGASKEADAHYEVEGPEASSASEASPSPIVPSRTESPKAKAPPTGEARTSRAGLEPSATVEEVWSRGAEWGGTLALLALA